MVKFVNRAKVFTSTTGTGTITLGSAVDGFQTFADAGVSNGDTIRYTIEDGDNWEIGSGVYSSSGTTLTRSVLESSNADAALNLSGSDVMVYVTAAAEDLLPTSGGTIEGPVEIIDNGGLFIKSETNGPTDGAVAFFSDHAGGSYGQYGWIKYKHSDGQVSNEPVTSYDGFIIGGTGGANTVVRIAGHVDVDQNLNVNGNIIVDGTVDGRNVSSDGAKLDGIESGATADQTKADIDALNIDADTLDGQHASAFASSSHSHTFASLTSKTSGTGDYSTNGDLVSGRGSGGVALTINDSKGNANVTFNHQNGVPEQNGNSGRIEVNTDGTTDAAMWIELGTNVTSGTSTNLTIAAKFSDTDQMLTYGGTQKFSTTSSGVDVLGNITVSGTVDGRDVAADGTKLDGIESGATADQTKADIDALNVDADTLDGQHGSYYQDWTNTTNKPDPTITLAGDLSGAVTLTDLGSGTLTATVADDSHNHVISNVDGLQTALDAKFAKAGGDVSGELAVKATNVAVPFDVHRLTPATEQVGVGFHTTNSRYFGKGTNDEPYWATTADLSSGNRMFHDAYHPNADKLTTSRTISLGGDLSGSVGFDGSSNVTLTATITDDSHNHVISNVDGLQSALDGKLASSGKAADSELLDGKDSSEFWRRIANTGATVGPGWVTVASASGNRYEGQVFVADTESSDHAFIHIEWLRSYADSNFTVLNAGGHANRITGVRVISEDADNTYGMKYLQVYVTTSSYYHVYIHRAGSLSGWGNLTSVTPVLENTKTGYTLHGSQLDDLDIYGFAAEEGILAGGPIRSNTSMAVQGNTVFHDNYHPNADKLTTARSITLSGDVSGSVAFDGTAGVNITTTIADDSHAHIIANVDGLQTALDGKLAVGAKAADADLLDGQHGSYYTGYTDSAIAALVDSSPGTLDTLNELAAALGDDPNFATTVTNNLAGKLDKSGGTISGNLDVTGNISVEVIKPEGSMNHLIINAGETHSYATGQTGENVYLNAENGVEINSSPDNWASGWSGRKTAYINNSSGNSHLPGNLTLSGTVDGRDVAADGSKLDGIEAGATADQTKADIDALGINAATLDGIDSSNFYQRNVSDELINFGAEKRVLSAWTGSGDSRWYLAPRFANNSGWDWANEFGWNLTKDYWYADGDFNVGGDLQIGGELLLSAPASPSITVVNLVDETLEVVFTQSTTANIDHYEVWSDSGGSSFGLISVITSEDFAATMSVIDSSFDAAGTVQYRVYAVKNGIHSASATISRAFTQATLDVSNMTVLADADAYHIAYELPVSRLLDHIEIYCHADASSSNLARGSASLVYSGQAHSFTYPIAAPDMDKFHQFWVECVES